MLFGKEQRSKTALLRIAPLSRYRFLSGLVELADEERAEIDDESLACDDDISVSHSLEALALYSKFNVAADLHAPVRPREVLAEDRRTLLTVDAVTVRR